MHPMATSRFGAARGGYQAVDLSSRIEGASPHRLVAILFDELLKALDAAAVAARRRDRGQAARYQSRALSVLHGLESSLDMEAGGEIAANLAVIYHHARQLTLEGGRALDAAPLVQAHAMLAEIASAWDAIG